MDTRSIQRNVCLQRVADPHTYVTVLERRTDCMAIPRVECCHDGESRRGLDLCFTPVLIKSAFKEVETGKTELRSVLGYIISLATNGLKSLPFARSMPVLFASSHL